jgi:adenylate cyclase
VKHQPLSTREAGRARSWPARIRRARLGTGLVLFAYVGTHLLNHSLGLFGLDAMEAGRSVFLAIWRNPAGTVALYGSLALHSALALWSLYQRRQLRMPTWEAAQMLLGFAIPMLLTQHAIGTRLGHEWYGAVDSYHRVLTAFWSRPDGGGRQALLLIVAWAHGCIGMHSWLRLRAWYPRAVPALSAFALLVPLLALLGYLEGMRSIAELVQRASSIRDTLSPENGAVLAQRRGLSQASNAVLSGYAASIALALVARALRNLYERRHRSVRIAYPNGREVVVPIGFTVLEASRFARIPHASVCGGRGRCSTCRVRIEHGLDSLPPASAEELRVLRRVGAAPNVRLACQTRPSRDLEVVPLLPASAAASESLARPEYVMGQERELCVLFADLRGFTRFAERKLPYDVVFFLNRYFEIATGAIEGPGGMVSQFIGDGVLGLFGVESGPGPGCRDAIDAARALVRGVEELSARLVDEMATPLRVGVGIHAGPAVVGHMGQGPAAHLTAIGDTVNLASRLQDLSKQYGCQLVISETAARQAGIDVSEFPRHTLTVRNRSEPIAIRTIDDVAALQP